AYAGLLLSVASRNQASLLPVAGLATSVSSLEQRFRFMTKNATSRRRYSLISAVALVALLLVATAMIPRPIRGVNAGALTAQSRALWLSGIGPHIVIQRGGVGILTDGSPEAVKPGTTTFFEYQVDKPATLRASVKPSYPAALKHSGVSGEVWAQFVVDESGRV